MSELPSGWTSLALGEVGAWIGGGTPSKSKSAFWTDGSIPWVSPKDMKRLRIEDAEDHITDAAVAGSSVKRVPKGAILMVTRSGILSHSVPVAITETDVTVNQDLKAIVPCEAVDPQYLLLSLRAMEDHFLSTCRKHGTTVASLNTERLKKTQLPVPPLPEQRRIVAKLDRLSACSAAARDHLARTTKLATRAKQAILRDAFKLPAAGNDGPDCSIGDWRIVTLSELIDDGPTNGWSPKADGSAINGTPTLKLSATTLGHLRLSADCVKYVSERLADNSKYWLKPGDLLVQRANSLQYLGASAIFDGPEKTYIYPDLMMRIRVQSDDVRQYLWRYLNSPMAREYFMASATGTAGNMPKISGETLKNLRVPIPPSKKVGMVVRRIEAAFARIDRLTEEATRAAHLLDRLDECLLAKAFRGELVPQDPNDESAESLLARIRQTRATAPNPKGERGREKEATA